MPCVIHKGVCIYVYVYVYSMVRTTYLTIELKLNEMIILMTFIFHFFDAICNMFLSLGFVVLAATFSKS